MDFVFITDSHFKASSNVRSGEYLEDLAVKLQYVVAYCNKHNAILLHGGDFFDKPSVPDVVKNRILPILMGLKTKCYIVSGNHCLLYNSQEFNYKTSYQTFVSAGLFHDMDNSTVDLGECIITNETPIINRGKPQLVLFHGFLNQEDGKNTLYFQDIANDIQDKVYILLGHDHTVYEPLQYSSNVKIFRPGSFSRQTREDASIRMPELLHIRVQDDSLQFKTKLIETARPAEEIFKTKLKNITKSQQRETYDDIIRQIRNAGAGEMSLSQALQTVAGEDVCEFAEKLLTDKRLSEQHNNNNL